MEHEVPQQMSRSWSEFEKPIFRRSEWIHEQIEFQNRWHLDAARILDDSLVVIILIAISRDAEEVGRLKWRLPCCRRRASVVVRTLRKEDARLRRRCPGAAGCRLRFHCCMGRTAAHGHCQSESVAIAITRTWQIFPS